MIFLCVCQLQTLLMVMVEHVQKQYKQKEFAKDTCYFAAVVVLLHSWTTSVNVNFAML